MKNYKKIFTLMIAGLFVIACGGADMSKEKTLTQRTMEGTPDDYDMMTAILGENPELDTEGLDEDTAQEQFANENATVDEDAIGGTMAVFLPTVKANYEEVPAVYTIAEANASQSIVMSDVPTGKEIEITPGVYDITFRTKKVAGNPDMTLRAVEFVAGRRLRREVNFPVGEITLDTPGAGCKTGTIKLKKKDGDWLPGKFKTCKSIMLMAGEYTAKQGITEITGIIVYDGGKRTITIRQQ